MPSIGEYQKPAGVNISKSPKLPGKRSMQSRNSTIKPSLHLDKPDYYINTRYLGFLGNGR